MTGLAILALTAVCAGLAIAFVGAAIRRLRSGGPARPADSPERAARRHRLAAVLRPQNAAELEELKHRITRAGLDERDALDLYLTIRLSLIIGAVLLSLLLATMVGDPALAIAIFAVVTGGAFVGPSLWLSSRIDDRHRQIATELPFTIDMLVTSLTAGLGLEQALERVAAGDRGRDDLLAAELRLTLAEIKAGRPTELAFRRLSARVGLEDVSTFAAVIAHATAMGTNVGALLRDHAKRLRQHRLLEIEERAGKANAKLTLPLTLCLLPAVLALLIGPALISIVGTL
jgi:tight adherence protein C